MNVPHILIHCRTFLNTILIRCCVTVWSLCTLLYIPQYYPDTFLTVFVLVACVFKYTTILLNDSKQLVYFNHKQLNNSNRLKPSFITHTRAKYDTTAECSLQLVWKFKSFLAFFTERKHNFVTLK